MKTETLKQWIEESKSVIIYHADGSACQLTDEDVRMIVDALEKQIPKKPKDGRLYYECPSCGLFVGDDLIQHIRCESCSQIIDWGEEE